MFKHRLILFLALCYASADLGDGRSGRFEESDFGDFKNTLDISKLKTDSTKLVLKADGSVANGANLLMVNDDGWCQLGPATSASWLKHYWDEKDHYYQFVGGDRDGHWLSYSISSGRLGSSSSWDNARAFSNTGCLSVPGQTWKTYVFAEENFLLIGDYNYQHVCLQTVEYPHYSVLIQYQGESSSCRWQPRGVQCPPYVTYYTATNQSTLALTVAQGLLFQNGLAFDTSGADRAHTGPKALLVMDIYGNLYASNQFKVYMFHHSSILGGADVTFAGEVTVKKGIIQEVTTCSGHYRPPIQAGTSLVTSLQRLGYYSSTVTVTPCSTFTDFIWDLDYNCVHESCRNQTHTGTDLEYNLLGSLRKRNK